MHTTARKARALRIKLITAAVSSCFASAAALANPTGMAVVQGTVSATSPLPGQLVITNSPNSIINWQGFSIGTGELTQFLQQSSSSAVLNRVVTNNASSILGSLQSNGRVFLINPNGIVFGSGSTVDVAGLVASSLNLSNEDFVAGNMHFQEDAGAGEVRNQGNIFAQPGGQVYLVGPAVTNEGMIVSPQGEVVLAAGNSVDLVSPATPGLSVTITATGNQAHNLGQILADSGRIGIFAGLIDQSGAISANSAFVGPDGSIQFKATHSITIAAGSDTSGGTLGIETGDLTVMGAVHTTGPQTIDATGGVVVRSELGGNALLNASGGQVINAGYVEVAAEPESNSMIWNIGGDQTISVTGANASGESLAVRGSGTGFASIVEGNGAQTIALTGSGPNALVMSNLSDSGGANIVGDVQTIVAGNPGQSGSITLYGPVSQIISGEVFGGTQSVSTSGSLALVGSPTASSPFPAGIFARGIDGLQTIHANSIVLQGGSASSGSSATITAYNGAQTIEAGTGGITLIGGASGRNNTAVIAANTGSQTIDSGLGGITLIGGSGGGHNFVMINQASSNPLATQTVHSTGGVLLQGGEGDFNFAMIRGFGGQQTFEAGNTTLLAGAGGIDNFTAIQGISQDMTVHGDLALTARGSVLGAAGGGSRIGGVGGGSPSATQLTLRVDGNLTMTAGSVAGTGTLLGGAPSSAMPNQISVTANGNVTLNGGTAANTHSRIGAVASSDAGGNIAITAGGTIALNSTAPDAYAVIRTADGVNLTAQQITEGPDARIEAGSLTVQTSSGASLTGANAVAMLSATNLMTGNLAFSNTSPLLTVGHATNINGAMSLRQSGDLLVNGDVSSGPQTIDVTGGLTVQNDPFGFAQIGASGGQTINAGYVAVNAVAGGSAGIFNFGGNQHIATTSSNVSGEGLSLQAVDGGFAFIDSPDGPQTIDVSGGLSMNDLFGSVNVSASGDQTITAQYIEINAAGGSAIISDSGGNQLISTFGSNAAGEGLAMRGADFGFASITADSGGQYIDVRNADRVVVDAGTGLANIFDLDGTQTVSVTGSGANALVLGSPGALAQSFIGGGSYQTVVAGNPGEQGSITLYGTDDGSFGNTLIFSSQVPGGTQTMSTSGALTVIGGSAPSNSVTGIFANGIGGQQTIQADSILLQGGASGSNNSAVIGANNGSQTIDVGAGGITLIGGADGYRNFAMINQALSDPAATQTVRTTGDVLLRGGEGNFNFAMIRGFGGQQTFEAGNTTLLAGAGGTDNFTAIQGRNQDMTVHGDLALTGRGSVGTPAAGGGSRIGGVGGGSPSATQLALQVDGNLTMTAGSVAGTGTLLGSAPSSAMPNQISVTANGNVTLNGGTAANTHSRIGAVASSDAGGNIAITAGGTIALNSTAPDAYAVIRTADGVILTAQQITEGPDARIQAGSLAVQTSAGASLTGANEVDGFYALNSVSGDVAFNNMSPLLTVTGVYQVPTGTLSVNQTGDLLLAGNVRSGAQSISASGDLVISPGGGPGLTVQAYGPQTFSAGGNFSLLGGSAWNGYAQATATGPMQINAGGDVRLRGGSGLLAYSLLYGHRDIRFTVGNELHIDHGTGLLAFARVQTDFWRRIFLDFPDRTSGGYFVNGTEGATYAGLDGFYTGFLPARLGQGLVVTYGE